MSPPPPPPVTPRVTLPRTVTAQPFAPPLVPRPKTPSGSQTIVPGASSGVAPRLTPPPAQPPALASRTTIPTPRISDAVVPRITTPTPIVPETTAPAKRAPNPFLANDPNQKAKRLARALVSDMVAYLPQKREEGLKNNTLKQLFREEIKKSYEEFVDQIGKEFAESTTHFQDALNDVLAGGKKIF
jgi:hypothetical protein